MIRRRSSEPADGGRGEIRGSVAAPFHRNATRSTAPSPGPASRLTARSGLDGWQAARAWRGLARPVKAGPVQISIITRTYTLYFGAPPHSATGADGGLPRAGRGEGGFPLMDGGADERPGEPSPRPGPRPHRD